MPYTFEDYQREGKEEVLKSLTKEDIEQLRKGLKPEEVLRGLNVDDLLKALKPEDRLKGLKREDIEEYLQKI
jgi:hypothetical protein